MPDSHPTFGTTNPDDTHRQAFIEYCTTSAHPPYRQVLQVLYEQFDQWNTAFFGQQLFPPHFVILAPTTPTRLGDYQPYTGWGDSAQIRLRPSLIDGSHPHLVHGSQDAQGLERCWLDVALHACVHYYCDAILEAPEQAEKGHGRIFAQECTRIGSLLDLPPVGPARRSRNYQGWPSCASWPQNVRPDDYYRGAYRPNPPTRQRTTDNPLTDAEWQQLRAALRGSDLAPLIDRLAAYHGVVDADDAC
ncbi:MAG: SprT family zinc-dependent metalloprotease [Blastochloris sp.]|nr:SprT family zinc-dependent metalloprotease [Blastochloris sp.]